MRGPKLAFVAVALALVAAAEAAPEVRAPVPITLPWQSQLLQLISAAVQAVTPLVLLLAAKAVSNFRHRADELAAKVQKELEDQAAADADAREEARKESLAVRETIAREAAVLARDGEEVKARHAALAEQMDQVYRLVCVMVADQIHETALARRETADLSGRPEHAQAADEAERAYEGHMDGLRRVGLAPTA